MGSEQEGKASQGLEDHYNDWHFETGTRELGGKRESGRLSRRPVQERGSGLREAVQGSVLGTEERLIQQGSLMMGAVGIAYESGRALKGDPKGLGRNNLVNGGLAR